MHVQRVLAAGMVAVVLAAIYCVWTFAGGRATPISQTSQRARTPEPVVAAPDGNVKVLQFYAVPGVLTAGQAAIVCYGVANAKSVRIDPPVDALQPSPNRCFEVRPKQDTRYTLSAEGADGRTVSESFALQVRPDRSTEPRVLSFSLKGSQTEYGKTVVSLCYQVENATAVILDPPEATLGAAMMGCFYVSPSKNTTYKLIATGSSGRKSQRELSVTVPEKEPR